MPAVKPAVNDHRTRSLLLAALLRSSRSPFSGLLPDRRCLHARSAPRCNCWSRQILCERARAAALPRCRSRYFGCAERHPRRASERHIRCAARVPRSATANPPSTRSCAARAARTTRRRRRTDDGRLGGRRTVVLEEYSADDGMDASTPYRLAPEAHRVIDALPRRGASRSLSNRSNRAPHAYPRARRRWRVCAWLRIDTACPVGASGMMMAIGGLAHNSHPEGLRARRRARWAGERRGA